MSRHVAALVTVLLTVLVTGCSAVPSDSPTVAITQVASPPDPDVGIEARGPEEDAQPVDIVRGFLDAAASPVRGHPVAREFLAPEQRETWNDTSGITVISSVYVTRLVDGDRVSVTAPMVGTLDSRGRFSATAGQQYTRTFALEQVAGQWRISTPPEGLVVLEPDFERTYTKLSAYYLDPTLSRVVPDPIFLVDGDGQPNSLVQRIIDGPSGPLAPGVVNALAGAQLNSNPSVSGQTVTIDLTGVPNLSPDSLRGVSAQLVWSLSQLSLRSVEILLDGEPIDVPGIPQTQTVDDVVRLDPDASPEDAVGHYLVDGRVQTVDGSPVPGPAGTGVYGLVAAAVSTDPQTGDLATLVGVTGGPQPALLAGPYGGDLGQVLTGATFTRPTSFATRQEVWTVRNGTEVFRVPNGGTPQPVDPTTLPDLGRTTVLQLSPDGVRAAAVVQGPAGSQLVVGTVVRTDSAVSLQDLRPVDPSMTRVSDVTWRTSSTLMVLAGDPVDGRTGITAVEVDGSAVTEVTSLGILGEPTAISAAPSRPPTAPRPPLVAAGGQLWQLSGGRWISALPDAGQVFGSAPFYPF